MDNSQVTTKITTIEEAVTFLVKTYSWMHKEHRFEKISDCAELIMEHEIPDTIFHHDNGSWVEDKYCDYFINLIETITTQWDKVEHENRSST